LLLPPVAACYLTLAPLLQPSVVSVASLLLLLCCSAASTLSLATATRAKIQLNRRNKNNLSLQNLKM
jgi:hypothetical protein